MQSLLPQSFLDDYNSQEIQDDYYDRVANIQEDLTEEINFLTNNRRGNQWEE